MKSIMAALFIFAVQAVAQWSQDPRVNTVWEQPENQGAPVICTDGAGGAIVAWGSDHGVRANRVDKFGYRQWGNNGAPVLPVPGPRTPTNIISDGRGGAIIIWDDFTKGYQSGNQDNPENEMYAQRLDRTGTRLWDTSGVVIRGFIAKAGIGDFQIVTDDHETYMISWFDQREPWQWYVQRIDLNGKIAFEKNGRPIPIESKTFNDRRRVISDGEGGMLMARFRANVNQTTIVDKVTKDGTFPWPIGGIDVHTGGAFDMTTDGHGGAIISGVYFTSGPPNYDAEGRIQHIDSIGSLRWGENEKVFAENLDVYTFLSIADDNQGGVYLSWTLARDSTREAKIQHFDSSGNTLWGQGGIRGFATLLDADTTGVSAIRSELVEGQPRVYNLYVQKYDRTGREAWISGGVLLRTRENSSYKFLSSISDGNGGLLFVWNEVVSGTGWDVVMQQVNKNGRLGEVITSVERIGNDVIPQSDFYLFPSFPNPFNPETTIRFSLQKPAKVSVRIMTLKGQNIVTLVERFLTPGIYQSIWTGLDTQGKRVSSGLYFVQVVANNQTQICKLLLIH